MRNSNTTVTNVPANVSSSVLGRTSEGPRAVEVVTQLGDSVVDVTHVALTNDNRSRRPAYLLLGAAVLLTLVAAGAFAKGVSTAAANERARVAWLQDGRQAHDFRPQLLSPVYDWAALGGLSLGLVAFGLGIARLRSSTRRTSLTIGSARGADICTASAPTALLPLVTQRDGQATVTIMPGMRAEMRVHGHSRNIDQLAALGLARPAQPGTWQLPVPQAGIVNVHVGPLRIGIRQVTAERSRLASLLGSFNARAGKFFGLSAIAHMAVLALFYTLPPDAYSLTMDPDGTHARSRKIQVRASELAKRHREDSPTTSNTTPDSPAKQGGDVQHTATNPAHKPMSPGGESTGHPRPQSRHEAMTLARTAGPLAVLIEQSGDLRMFSGGPALAMNDSDITSLILDDSGPGGPRFGGPSTGWNNIPGTIKASPYGDIIGDPNGVPNGRPHGQNPGPELKGRPSGDRAPIVDIKPPIVHGGLDKSIIRRHIKRKIARIQHCYERELTVNPDISGTVTTEFMVNGQGKVIYANASGIGSERLESCISSVVASVQFPRPGDQASVKVKYPFHFRRAG